MSWYRHWFSDELYLQVYSHRDASEARQAIDLFERTTGLPPDSSTVLDLACGTGRHSFELARRGYRVLAADLSAPLLAVAKRKTRRFGSSLDLIRADMRHLPFSNRLDAVAQLFTAFGYFPDDAENEDVISGIAASLRPGGWYMLDYLNPCFVKRTLIPRSTREIGDAHVIEERRISGNRVEKRITVSRDGTPVEYHESVRLFTADEIVTMFKQNGFEPAAIYGSYSGDSFSENSSRCILFGKRDDRTEN